MKLNSSVFNRKMAYFKDMPLFIYFVNHNVVFYRVSVVFLKSGRYSFLSSSISSHGFPDIKDVPYSVSFKLCSDSVRTSEINLFHDFLVNCTDKQLLTYYSQCYTFYLSSAFGDFFDCFNDFLRTVIGDSRLSSVLETVF